MWWLSPELRLNVGKKAPRVCVIAFSDLAVAKSLAQQLTVGLPCVGLPQGANCSRGRIAIRRSLRGAGLRVARGVGDPGRVEVVGDSETLRSPWNYRVADGPY